MAKTLSNQLKVNELINLMVNYATALTRSNDGVKVNNLSKLNPIMMWGSPGVGKSDAMRQVSRILEKKLNKKVAVHDVRLLLMNPVDLRGIPVADASKEVAIWLRPHIFQMNPSDEYINILILDEISAAPPSVQAAAYQIVLDRQIGEHKIPDNCLILCAGNKVTDKSVAYKMPKALANRLSHIEIEVSLDDWKLWAINHGIDARILAYLNSKPDKLYDFQPDTDDNSFPTPRSWEKVDNILKVLTLDEGMPLISGHIGQHIAYDFMTFTAIFNELPDVQGIIKGKVKDVSKRPDVNFAVISSLVAKAKDLTDEELDNIMEYGMVLSAEFAVLLFKDLVKSIEGMGPRMAKSKVFGKFLEKYSYLIQDK